MLFLYIGMFYEIVIVRSSKFLVCPGPYTNAQLNLHFPGTFKCWFPSFQQAG